MAVKTVKLNLDWQYEQLDDCEWLVTDEFGNKIARCWNEEDAQLLCTLAKNTRRVADGMRSYRRWCQGRRNKAQE